MNKAVIWTDEARSDAATIIRYILSEFGPDAANKAINTLYDNIELLSFFPFRGLTQKKYPPYRILHSKHNSIIYAVREDYIEITRIWDNRRDEKKIMKTLDKFDKQ